MVARRARPVGTRHAGTGPLRAIVGRARLGYIAPNRRGRTDDQTSLGGCDRSDGGARRARRDCTCGHGVRLRGAGRLVLARDRLRVGVRQPLLPVDRQQLREVPELLGPRDVHRHVGELELHEAGVREHLPRPAEHCVAQEAPLQEQLGDALSGRLLRLPEDVLMRMTTTGRCLWTAIVAAAAVVVAEALLLALATGRHASSPRATSFVAATGASERKPHFKPDTREELGLFRVARGRVSLSTADALEAGACLIEGDRDGETSSCLDDGLFATRKAELIVSSGGGPGHFDELQVVGVVAPSIRSARLVKTDGTEVELVLNARRAFVYESPAGDLAAQVYPTALRMFGSNGKLVDTVDFPAAG